MRTNYVPKTGFSEIAHPLARGRSDRNCEMGFASAFAFEYALCIYTFIKPGPGVCAAARPVTTLVLRLRQHLGFVGVVEDQYEAGQHRGIGYTAVACHIPAGGSIDARCRSDLDRQNKSLGPARFRARAHMPEPESCFVRRTSSNHAMIRQPTKRVTSAM